VSSRETRQEVEVDEKSFIFSRVDGQVGKRATKCVTGKASCLRRWERPCRAKEEGMGIASTTTTPTTPTSLDKTRTKEMGIASHSQGRVKKSHEPGPVRARSTIHGTVLRSQSMPAQPSTRKPQINLLVTAY
jgi:hypothetical protein